MKVLMVTGEAWPFVKTGGLGDVAHSLPKALKKAGVDVRVVLPKYTQIPYEYKEKMTYIGYTYTRLDWRNAFCGVEVLEYEGVTYYFLDNEQYFNRWSVYGEVDDCERFSFFCSSVLNALEIMDFEPDIIHCNDWHTGLLPAYLRDRQSVGIYPDIKVVYTIHNLKYQGIFSKENLGDTIALPFEKFFNDDGLQFYDCVSFMKGGINYADRVSIVSETYAKEVEGEHYGEGLHGLFHRHHEKMRGIVNGIDYDIYNPRTDAELTKKFGQTTLKDKTKNKLALQREFALEEREDVPVIGFVSRFTEQKGLDIIAYAMEELLAKDIQMIFIGTGEEKYEQMVKYFTHKYPNKMASYIGFDHAIAKKIYASCDMYLMPSLFEPCGLSQMIAMRYGTIPIVRETGGLKDTIKPYNNQTKSGTGFTFNTYNAHDMVGAIDRALDVYSNDKKTWREIQLAGMKEKNSWHQAAKKYVSLYKEII